ETAVVVRGVEQARGRQGENLAAHRAVHLSRVALLKIGAAAAPDQQAIAGERHALVVENVGYASAGVSGRRANLDIALAELDSVAVGKIAVGALGAARSGERDGAAQAALQ